GFALAPLLITFCFTAQAQQAKKIPMIGVLRQSSAHVLWTQVEAFRQGLRERGYSEGQNIRIEYRFADQKPERLPELAAELVRLKVDLIVTTADPAGLAAKKATSTIPIVANASDLVGLGLVDSLARPEGNVTGLSGLANELNTKRLEI